MSRELIQLGALPAVPKEGSRTVRLSSGRSVRLADVYGARSLSQVPVLDVATRRPTIRLGVAANLVDERSSPGAAVALGLVGGTLSAIGSIASFGAIGSVKGGFPKFGLGTSGVILALSAVGDIALLIGGIAGLTVPASEDVQPAPVEF